MFGFTLTALWNFSLILHTDNSSYNFIAFPHGYQLRWTKFRQPTSTQSQCDNSLHKTLLELDLALRWKSPNPLVLSRSNFRRKQHHCYLSVNFPCFWLTLKVKWGFPRVDLVNYRESLGGNDENLIRIVQVNYQVNLWKSVWSCKIIKLLNKLNTWNWNTQGYKISIWTMQDH